MGVFYRQSASIGLCARRLTVYSFSLSGRSQLSVFFVRFGSFCVLKNSRCTFLRSWCSSYTFGNRLRQTPRYVVLCLTCVQDNTCNMSGQNIGRTRCFYPVLCRKLAFRKNRKNIYLKKTKRTHIYVFINAILAAFIFFSRKSTE